MKVSTSLMPVVGWTNFDFSFTYLRCGWKFQNMHKVCPESEHTFVYGEWEALLGYQIRWRMGKRNSLYTVTEFEKWRKQTKEARDFVRADSTRGHPSKCLADDWGQSVRKHKLLKGGDLTSPSYTRSRSLWIPVLSETRPVVARGQQANEIAGHSKGLYSSWPVCTRMSVCDMRYAKLRGQCMVLLNYIQTLDKCISISVTSFKF